MKWNAQPIPKRGDLRRVRKFALFPIRCGDKTVWLEEYDVVSEYGCWWDGCGWCVIGKQAL